MLVAVGTAWSPSKVLKVDREVHNGRHEVRLSAAIGTGGAAALSKLCSQRVRRPRGRMLKLCAERNGSAADEALGSFMEFLLILLPLMAWLCLVQSATVLDHRVAQ